MNQHEQHTNSSSRNTIVEHLDPVRIQWLKTVIEGHFNQGKRKRYSILVDGEMVVPVTSNPEHFEDYERYVTSSTRTVEVRMYFGKSPKFNSHQFKAGFAGLNGTQGEFKQQMETALKQKDQEHQISRLEDKIKRKDKKIEKLEELCTDLEETIELKNEEIETLKSSPSELAEKWAPIIMAFKNGGNTLSANPSLGGGNDTSVEVQVNDVTPSLLDQQLERLKKQYSEIELLKAIKGWEDSIVFARNQKNK